MRACHEEYPHIVPVLVTVDGLFLLYLSLSLYSLFICLSPHLQYGDTIHRLCLSGRSMVPRLSILLRQWCG